MNIVVVESPAKAKTINKYLGPGYEVLASFGHIRDLPAKDGSVDPNANFRMLWEVDAKSNQRINDIARALKGADKLILATDPDREGEAISWHVLEVLKEKKALKDQAIERVVFNAITKQAILDAMKHPRKIDAALVDAYLARRALDYLVGFTLSPVLWRKLPGARSAGRVQSVALRLVCDRELEIEKFVAKEYWSIAATLATPRNDTFEARLTGADGRKIQRLDIGSGAEAEAFTRDLENATFKVANVEAKPARRNPPPPFTTSTMQQEASRKLGFSPAHTMRLAQRLYEGIDIGGETVGLITYMRTDGIDMAPEAITAIRQMIGKDYGAPYVPETPRTYQQKSKTAQEAHEAVRPTDPNRSPKDVAKSVDRDQARLYELIWNRTVASQMQSAELERTTVDILPAEAVVPLSEHPNIIGIKDSSGNIQRVMDIVRDSKHGFQVLVGSAPAFLPSLLMGASGGILAFANAAPYATIAIWEAYRTREEEAARDWQNRVGRAAVLTAKYGIAGLKHAMDLNGYYGGPPRLPLSVPTPEAKQVIEEAFKDLKG